MINKIKNINVNPNKLLNSLINNYNRIFFKK